MMLLLRIPKYSFQSSDTNNTVQHRKTNIAQLPDEIIELITIYLSPQDLRSFRLTCKRLAIVTTHLIAALCDSHHKCINATHSLTTLVQGSRIALLNRTTTDLTLSAPSWRSISASYDDRLREVSLSRLTSLYIDSINITHPSALTHFLEAHTTTLSKVYFFNVHAPNLPAWRAILLQLASTRGLELLRLRQLFYSAGRNGAVFLIPRSTYSTAQSMMHVLDEGSAAPREREMLATTAASRADIERLIGDFLDESGQLRMDLGHEQRLAAEKRAPVGGRWWWAVRRTMKDVAWNRPTQMN
ncbi:hypothetical protein WHR41_03809 [Cladosporium halotolerans]|uniref:F-box domain-containing protein n=1 Tax=Cladosporium halotolerans TaxID=1052096 RepID=A0AB34KRW8_9PEZI